MQLRLESWTRTDDVFPLDFVTARPFLERLPTGVGGIDLLFDRQILNFALAYDTPPSAETLTHVLADLVLPRLLAYEGHHVLHGSIVNGGNGVLGFMGPSGQGKSTLSASLHQAGHTLMTDDAVILRKCDARYRAERLHPSLRLFPDSLERIFTGIGSTSPVADYTDKRHVPFDTGPDTAPMAALFRLTEPSDDIRVVRLSQAEACIALVANSFALDALDADETKRRFVKAADVARHVPVYNLSYPRDYAALPEVHTKIFETVAIGDLHEILA